MTALLIGGHEGERAKWISSRRRGETVRTGGIMSAASKCSSILLQAAYKVENNLQTTVFIIIIIIINYQHKVITLCYLDNV